MIRRYNYTGRKSIPQKCIRIRINNDTKIFDASWNLDGIDVPSSGQVCIEAFSSGSPDVQRYQYGTVGTPNPSASTRFLGMFPSEVIAFNFKVIDVDENQGRLLGVSPNIKPIGDDESEAGQQSILPINPTDLGQQVWRLNYNHSRPWLEVNNQIPDIMTIAREDRQFFSLVYPAVIRQILTRILIVEEWSDISGSKDDWRVQWLMWGTHWHPDNEQPSNDPSGDCQEEWLEWIEEVAQAFCRKHMILEKYTFTEEEGK